ncbi:hypothetical protein BH10PSE11_BH10PSE11_30860 [soil metagenome]
MSASDVRLYPKSRRLQTEVEADHELKQASTLFWMEHNGLASDRDAVHLLPLKVSNADVSRRSMGQFLFHGGNMFRDGNGKATRFRFV